MLLADGTFCADTANIWQVLGFVVNIIKIVIPLILIILGMLDLGKAVVASDDKAISKSVNSLVKRFVAAVVMFFIPTIISAIFSVVANVDLRNGDANICVQCVTNVNGETLPNPDKNKTEKVSCDAYADDALGITGNEEDQ